MKKTNKILIFALTLTFALSTYGVTLTLNTKNSGQYVSANTEDVLENIVTTIPEERYPIKGYLDRHGEITEKWTEEQIDFYFKTNRECMETIVPIAKQMAEKRWENIYCHQVFPEKYDEWGLYLTAEEEYAEICFALEGSVNGFYIVIPVIFTPEFPEGKITRVIYTGRSNWNPGEGRKTEIVDAYDVDLWKSGYCD